MDVYYCAFITSLQSFICRVREGGSFFFFFFSLMKMVLFALLRTGQSKKISCIWIRLGLLWPFLEE